MGSLRIFHFIFVSLIFGFGSLATAAPRACPRIHAGDGGLFEPAMALKVGPGRYVFYRQVLGDPKKPTLVLLPGLNRAIPEEYQALEKLADQGYNLLITATSSHWQSLRTLEKNETPFFEQKSDLSGADFNKETEALIKKLKVKNPVLVALSYSSVIAVSSKLPKIYVAPLVRPEETNPQAFRTATQWESALAMNPFLGSVRDFRDRNYRKFWSSKAQGVDLEGYISISRTTEDFDLAKTNFKGPHERVFILGENETQVRLRGQVETIAKAIEHGPTRVILVRKAEHNVLESQPEGFAVAMQNVLTKKNNANLQVGVIDTRKSKSLRWLKASEYEKLFRMILGFGESTAEADLSPVLGE